MFCRQCGNELKDKAVVCSGCGSPVVEGVDLETIPTTAPRWSWFTMLVTIGVILLLLLIAIIAGL
jgi:uncharacterized membrane protein YvbJ